MATTREEVQIRLGMDSKALQSGMASMKAKMSAWAKSVGGQMMQGIGFATILNQFKKVIDSVEQLTQRADALSVSASFLQDLENVGIAAGKSQAQMEKMLTMFAKGLAPGQDLETEFYKFLDAIKAIEDPVMRTKMAFDKFGKSGIILLDVAKNGSAAFKAMAAEMQKFSKAEIDSLLVLDKQLDMAKNSMTKFMGWLVGVWSDYWQMEGRRNVTGESFERIGVIMRAQKASAILAEEQANREEKRAARKAADQDRINAALSKELQIKTDIGKLIDKSNETMRGLKGERAGALRGLSDTPLSSAEESANARFGAMGGKLNFSDKQLGDVRLAEQMDFQSKQQRIYGKAAEADRLQEMRRGVLKRLGFLSPDEQDPLRGINEKMIEANKQAEKLYELAANKGMAVKLVEIP